MALIMSLMSTQILVNMAQMQYNPRWCHDTGILSLENQNEIRIELTNSFGTNYVFNDHENIGQYDTCNIISNNAMLQLSFKSGKWIWNQYWIFMLTNSSSINHAINDYEDFVLYDPYQIISEIIPFCKFVESQWNPYWVVVLTSSSCTNFMSLKSMKIFTNMAICCDYCVIVSAICDTTKANWCHVRDIMQVWSIKMKSLLSKHINEPIWHYYHVLSEHEYIDQYDPYAITSEQMSCCISFARLVNQDETLIELSC